MLRILSVLQEQFLCYSTRRIYGIDLQSFIICFDRFFISLSFLRATPLFRSHSSRPAGLIFQCFIICLIALFISFQFLARLLCYSTHQHAVDCFSMLHHMLDRFFVFYQFPESKSFVIPCISILWILNLQCLIIC